MAFPGDFFATESIDSPSKDENPAGATMPIRSRKYLSFFMFFQGIE